jgi:hypothetical protein
MEDKARVTRMDAETYFTSIRLGVKWHNYEELKRVVDLRSGTTVIGYLPNRLAYLVAEDADDLGLAA